MKKILFSFFFFLSVSLFFAHHPIILSLFKNMQTDPGDTRFNNYILEHIHISIKKGFKDFFSPNFFYPQKNNLFFSDLQIFYYPFYGIFRFIGFEYDTSFQLFMIFSTILNFSFSFYLFHKIDETKPFFNSFGAFFFSSANMRICQLSHQQLLPNIYISLCFIFLFFIYKNFKENNKKTKTYIFLFTFSLIFQAWSGFYNFYMLFLYLLFLFLLILIFKAKEFMLFFKKYIVLLVFSLIIFIIFLLPYLHNAKILKKEIRKRSLQEVYTMLPQWKSYFYLGEENIVYGNLGISKFFQTKEAAHEHRLGFGFITLGIFLISIFLLKKEFLIKINCLVILIFFIITLYIPPEITLWKIFYNNLFGANALRSITRFALILLLPVSFVLLKFLKKINPKISLILCFLITLEQVNKIPSYEKYSKRKDVDALKNLVQEKKLPFYYSPLFGTDHFWKYQLDAQWAALLSGIPTINGYSGNYPKNWSLFQNNIKSDEDLIRISKNLKIWFGEKKFFWIQTIPNNEVFLTEGSSIIPEKLHYFIDKISDKNWKEFENPIKITKEKEIKISGWAKDLRFKTEECKLFIKINDFTFPLNYWIKREDVSGVYGIEYLNCGFEGKIDCKYLKSKNNQISFIVICKDKFFYLKKTKWNLELI